MRLYNYDSGANIWLNNCLVFIIWYRTWLIGKVVSSLPYCNHCTLGACKLTQNLTVLRQSDCHALKYLFIFYKYIVLMS